jgi:hypothetical protein
VTGLFYRLEPVKLLTFLFLWRYMTIIISLGKEGGDMSCNRRIILVYFEGRFKKLWAYCI